MRYNFIERQDHGEKVVATVEVVDSKVVWSGESVEPIQNLLSRDWDVLGEEPFDENNPKHWVRLPLMISGSRLFVQVEL